MATAVLQVQGMTCGHCVQAVEGAVRGLGASAKVDLHNGKVDVEFDEANVTLTDIKAAIEDQGYDVQ